MSGLPDRDPTLDLPYAHGRPDSAGQVRAEPEDFVVEEVLGYSADGEGEHCLLTIRKRLKNTLDVAQRIAKLAGVRQVSVGFAGLKDKFAVTTQSFSVHLPGKPDPDWSQLADDGIELLSARRHQRKIRRGALRGNRFRLRIREVQGGREAVEQRFATIAAHGVPNYFGSQRFGRQGQNLSRADQLLRNPGRRMQRDQRGILLSAARSYLFNLVLARRIEQGSWNQALGGDVVQLAGSQKHFVVETLDAEIQRRVAEFDLHPTGPLPGQASHARQPTADTAALEMDVLAPHQEWLDGLVRQGLEHDRRALRLMLIDPEFAWQGDDLELSFELAAGAYATSVLRELIRTGDA